MKFLIQTIDGEVKHDFSFTLLRAFDFYKEWYDDEKEFVLSDNYLNEKGYVPVGSVEFVTEYLVHNYGILPKPINIPNQLINHQFLGRFVINSDESYLSKTGMEEMFIKSNDKIKGFTDIGTKETKLEKGNYMFSEIVDFVSEYRCFVFEGELIGMNHYIGDFSIFPDMEKIKRMIKAYSNSPCVYTLDIGILDSGKTVIVEVHDFFSCGLYGFSNLQRLPVMYTRWIYEYLMKNGKF